MLASYSNSKLIDVGDNLTQVRPGSVVGTTVQDWSNLSHERSKSLYDVPQRLVVTGLWELPFGKNGNGIYRTVVGGWQVNAIMTLQSGSSIPLGASVQGGGNRPNVIAGVSDKAQNQSLSQWFNTAAFSAPAPFTYGTASRTLPDVMSDGVLSGVTLYVETTYRLIIFAVLCVPLASARVKTGLEVLMEQDFAPIAGKRVGVIANQNSLARDRRNIVSVLAATKRLKLVAIFSPEHGFQGTSAAGADIGSGKDPSTGVPIYSLYHGGSYRPTAAMLRGIDVLVYDLQDVGARFYTYATTLGYMMEAAAPLKIPIYVLDRPDPINGLSVEGPVLDDKYVSMIGYGKRPTRPGMTIGELALLFNGENKIGADVHVIKMEGWDRRMWLDETGLEWINPSPNIRNLTAATLFPATCLVENRLVSVGRGTDAPFTMFGAPWLKNLEMAGYLNARNIPGIRFLARHFTPNEDPYKGQDCAGIDVQLLDRNQYDSARTGLELLAAMLKFHPDKFTLDRKIMLLLGSDKAAALLKQGKSGAEVEQGIRPDVEAFLKIRQKYLLY
jgi:uncharacterized protein YbbC (DUF1343 family)